MRQQTRSSKEPAEKVVQDIRRATRKHYSAEEKIRNRAGRPARRGQHRRALAQGLPSETLTRRSARRAPAVTRRCFHARRYLFYMTGRD